MKQAVLRQSNSKQIVVDYYVPMHKSIAKHQLGHKNTMNQGVARLGANLDTNAPRHNWTIVYRLQNGKIAFANFAQRTIKYYEFAKPIDKIYTSGKYVAFVCVTTLYIANAFSQQTIFSAKNATFGGFLNESNFFLQNKNNIQVYSIIKEQAKEAYKIAFEGALEQVVQAGACIAMTHGYQVDNIMDYYFDGMLSVFWREKKLKSVKGIDLRRLQASDTLLVYAQAEKETCLRHVYSWSPIKLDGMQKARFFAVQRGCFIVWNNLDVQLINDRGKPIWQITISDCIPTNIVIMDEQYFLIQSGFDWFIYNVENGKQEFWAKCPDSMFGYSNTCFACSSATKYAKSIFSACARQFCDVTIAK